jgi:hypothetical protein
MFGLGSTLILGVPLYLLLRKHVRPSFWKIVLIGGILGAAPILALSGTHILGLLFRSRTSIIADYGINSIDDIVVSFVMGLIGGVVFWLCTISGESRFSKQVNA